LHQIAGRLKSWKPRVSAAVGGLPLRRSNECCLQLLVSLSRQAQPYGQPGIRHGYGECFVQQKVWRSAIMQVRHILQNKGRDVVAISMGATLAQAAHLLSERHIGVVIVQDNGGALAGILSERDLVRAVAQDGPLGLNRCVGAYMTSNVATCVESDTVEALMEMMTMGRFRHVPVLDERKKLCGLISIGDVVKTRIAETVSEANSLREYISATA
jgi:CBS domain-containing protein